ncbi:abortive infection family protein [Novosphingobium sp.]|uniref:abortive infection family protein n=1 Tax=Novosphingobium sp. TaxID=1874826 RepID=UPI002FDDEEB7
MSADWYVGIRSFCDYWRHAPTLQQTFKALEDEFNAENDACVDAAKAMVECACRLLVDELDDPIAPVKPKDENPDFGKWLAAAVRVLHLDQVRDEAFKKLISQYHKLGTTLGDLRNKAGTMSHGKDGFIAKLSAHQRRASVLAADAIISFLHEAYIERQPELIRTREPYERFTDANKLIDDNVAVAAAESEFDAAVDISIVLPNDDAINLTIEASRLLFEFDREAYVAALLACREATAVGDQGDES